MAMIAGVLLLEDFYPEHFIASFAWPLLLQAGGMGVVVGSELELTSRADAAASAQPGSAQKRAGAVATVCCRTEVWESPLRRVNSTWPCAHGY
ncbi:MAG TPA: hypothetical protein VIJ18_00015 [Microbacteriaceae bacterium]